MFKRVMIDNTELAETEVEVGLHHLRIATEVEVDIKEMIDIIVIVVKMTEAIGTGMTTRESSTETEIDVDQDRGRHLMSDEDTKIAATKATIVIGEIRIGIVTVTTAEKGFYLAEYWSSPAAQKSL